MAVVLVSVVLLRSLSTVKVLNPGSDYKTTVAMLVCVDDATWTCLDLASPIRQRIS